VLPLSPTASKGEKLGGTGIDEARDRSSPGTAAVALTVAFVSVIASAIASVTATSIAPVSGRERCESMSTWLEGR
jgi:hypothetical protein